MVFNLPKPQLITRQIDVQRIVESLTRFSAVAVDTESNSLYAYQEHVCLIQLSAPGVDYIIDPLAMGNLDALGELFRNDGVEKIFHAAEYDVICMKRDFGFEFTNLFDTMLAARILGIKEVGLGAMLKAHFGIKVDKRLQRANWGQRPLPEDLLAYAQVDTHYLIPLRDGLHDRLVESGRLPLAEEDFRRVCQVNGKNCENKSEDCWRINGAYDLPAQKAAVLLELCRYRDQAARAVDRPLFKVFSEQTLMSIATRCPQGVEEIKDLPGMSPNQIRRYGKGLLEAVKRGLKEKPVYPPRQRRPSEEFLVRLDNLRAWRKRTAQKMGVMSDVVLPRDLMCMLAKRNPKNKEALSAAMESVPWRHEHFGKDILEALQKPLAGIPIFPDGKYHLD